MWIFREWGDPTLHADPEIILVDLPASVHKTAVDTLVEKITPMGYSVEEIVETLTVVVVTFRQSESSFRYTRIFYEHWQPFEGRVLEL